METGLDRSSPSSTAVDMIVRNSRYTLATVFEDRPALCIRPYQDLTLAASISRRRTDSKVLRIRSAATRTVSRVRGRRSRSSSQRGRSRRIARHPLWGRRDRHVEIGLDRRQPAASLGLRGEGRAS